MIINWDKNKKKKKKEKEAKAKKKYSNICLYSKKNGFSLEVSTAILEAILEVILNFRAKGMK